MNKLALYGSDFYSRISKELRAELPEVKSFSVTKEMEELQPVMNKELKAHSKEESIIQVAL
jgi:hypothetical protein